MSGTEQSFQNGSFYERLEKKDDERVLAPPGSRVTSSQRCSSPDRNVLHKQRSAAPSEEVLNLKLKIHSTLTYKSLGSILCFFLTHFSLI